MTETDRFINKLMNLRDADLSRLRRFIQIPLNESVEGFDLFTGLWWPLRARSPAAPRKEASFLIAGLFASFAIPHNKNQEGRAGPSLAQALAQCEPWDSLARDRYRRRFDLLLRTALSELTPDLVWALSCVEGALMERRLAGLDWVSLLDDISIWDKGSLHRRRQDIKDIWAEQYIEIIRQRRGGKIC